MESQPGWYYHSVENALYHQTDMGNTWYSLYPLWSRAQALHSMGELVENTPPNKELQITSVAPQGMRLLLTGIVSSKQSKQTQPMPWIMQPAGTNNTEGNKQHWD